MIFLTITATGIRYENALECSIFDYGLCERTFHALNATECLASALENYRSIDEPEANEAFHFTRNGPPKVGAPTGGRTSPSAVRF